jgi:HTH-type transcriptional regulator / antitoxin HigA
MNAILDFTKPHLLRDQKEFDAAVEEIDRLLESDLQPGSEGYDRLEFLSVLVRAYEQEHYPDIWEPVSPPELVEFMLEQRGLTRTDLYDCMGGKSRVSEFLSGSRRLSISQIIALRDKLGIPADLLIQSD